MLFTEKFAVVVAHACVCSCYSPYFVMRDLNRAEARIRGIDIDPPVRGDPDHSMCWHIIA
jgi:hypothetical protein